MELNHIAILYPSGNTTALVFDPVPKSSRRVVNDFILETDPSVEVVMFVDRSGPLPEGVMAGGEFCGNASRSLGYYLLNKNPRETSIKVSGMSAPIKVSVQGASSKVEFPVSQSDKTVSLGKDGTAFVTLGGISHLILKATSSYAQRMLSIRDMAHRKAYAQKLLIEKGLMDIPTCGVIAVAQSENKTSIFPYIHSNTLDDWYAETACGSGSLSVALVAAKENEKTIGDMHLRQPSGRDLIVGAKFEEGSFRGGSIAGDVELLYEGKFSSAYRPAHVGSMATGIHKFSYR